MPTAPPTPAVRDPFLTDHRELEDLFARLLAAFGASDREGVATLWKEFDERVARHLAAEEQYLIPRLSSTRPRDARALLAEHRHIRSRLLELGCCVELHIVGLETASGFIDELRAHARHEDDVLYRWADDHLLAGEQYTVVASLEALEAPQARPRAAIG